jgi:transposase InsO family protein
MRRDIENYIRKCASCQRNKHTVKNTKMGMEVTDPPYATFEKISLGCMGPLPLTAQGNRYILTCQDQLSKYLVAIALPNQDAVTVTRALVDNVITVFGSQGSILTDCASNFTGEIRRHLCKLLRISKINTIPFRPQSNGNVERSHAVITEYLRHFICHEQNDWDALLPTATFVYNTTSHTSTKYCSFELVSGRKPSMSGLLQRLPSCPYYDERGDFVSCLKKRLR